MATIKNNSDGSLGIQGAGQLDDGGFTPVSVDWIATTVDKRFFTATRAYRVKGAIAAVTVAGNDAGAVTAVIRKVPSGTAITGGTAIHTGSINLKGTADTKQALTLSTTSTDLDIAAGDSLALDVTGTLTLATGSATVVLAPK